MALVVVAAETVFMEMPAAQPSTSATDARKSGLFIDFPRGILILERTGIVGRAPLTGR
jgi:hypothetical protein